MKTINTRRSIRKYSDKEVSGELLSRLLAEASRTQTMGNMQLYSVVVTRSREMKERLAPAHFNQPMVTQAPVVLTVCADFNRASAWCRQRKAEPGYDNFLSFVNAATDALLYTQTLCNLAEEAAAARHARGHHHAGLAGRGTAPERPPAAGVVRPRRDLPRLFAL